MHSLPRVAAYVPAMQSIQSSKLVLAATDDLPAAQSRHGPPPDEYLPAAQVTQSVDIVLPKASVALPAAHAMQVPADASEYVPATHKTQSLLNALPTV